MGRKVFITSDMSSDIQLMQVAEENQQAVMIWPWILTMFDDWGRASAHPKQLKIKVFPFVDSITPEVIEEALRVYEKYGLLQLYEVDGRPYMAIEADKWFKYQTHIRRDKRENDDSKIPPPNPREDARSHAKIREKNCKKQPSPSPSPSPTPTPSKIHIDISEVIAAWNRIGICQHKETDTMVKAVQKGLKKYGKATILEAINRYMTVYRDKSFYYSHPWRLDTFLKQSNGVPYFTDEGQIWISYLDHKQKKQSNVSVALALVDKYEREEATEGSVFDLD